MSVSQKNSDQNFLCTYKLPIPIGELLESYRQQALQEATNSALEGGAARRREKSSSEGVLYFCSLENFESAIVYLSQELQALGLGNLSLTTAGSHSTRTHDALATAFTGGVHRGTLLQLDLVCLVNRCWEVVQLYRASVRDGCTLQEQHRRDANANTKLQASVSGLQEVRQDYDRKLQEAAELRRQAVEEAARQREALALQKEELRHLNALLLQRDTQYKHDLRRRELEAGRLRARLGHLVAEGGGPVERRLEVSSCLMPSLPLQEDRARAKWSSFADSSKHTVEVYRRVLGQYECWLAGVSAERDLLARCVETTAAALNTLVKKHAKVLAAEDMAASLTDSVYSTDSLDEPLTPTEGGPEVVAAAGLHGLQQQIREGLLALSVVLAEKGAGDPREARLKRIQELAASATPQATKSSSCRLSTGQLGRRAVVSQGKHEDVNSEGKVDGCPSPGEGSLLVRRDTAAPVPHGGVASSDSAIFQLVRHLGIVTATEGDGSLPLRAATRGDSTSSLPGCLLPGSECTPTRPSAGSGGTSILNAAFHDAPTTSTPDLAIAQAAPTAPAPVSSAPGAVEGDACLHELPAADGANRGAESVTNQLQSGGTNERESINGVGDDGNGVDSGIGGDGNQACNEGTASPGSMKRNVLDSPASEVTDLSWLRVCGGPDDSAATEVMTLKKLLEEERLEVKREKERYAEAAIRLNRERAAFEQDKVQLLRQQFLDEVPGDDDVVSSPADLACLTPADASFYQVSPVPAWLSRHHHRPFRPAPGSPGPAGPAQSAAGRHEPHQHRELGQNGAPERAQQKTRDRQKPHNRDELGPTGASQAAQRSRGHLSTHHREEPGRHKRASAPSPPSRLTSVPNITPPPPLEWEFRARSRPLLLTRAKAGKSRNSSGGSCDSGRSRHCSVAAGGAGRRSAPATRAPSATRSHGDGCSDLSCTVRHLGAELRGGGSSERFSFTLGSSKSRSPSLGLRVASSSSRLSSKSRDSSLSRHSSKGRESSATSSSNTRDSSVSRLANRNRESSMSNRGTNDGFAGSVAGRSSVRYHTLPRSYKSSLKPANENGPLEKLSVPGLSKLSETSSGVVNWTGAEGDWIIARGPALVARHSGPVGRAGAAARREHDTPTSRSRGRQQAALFSSKSLPRTLHKTSASIPALDAACMDLRSSSEIEQVDDSSRRRPGQTDLLPTEKQNNMRPKSDSFSQAVDINDLYASLTPELLSKIDSNDGLLQNSSVLSDKVSDTCSGACKEFLKVPSTAACLCHLLRQKRISLEREESELSLPVSTDASDFDAFDSVSQAELHHDFKTNQRIDAIESSLWNLISQITSNDKNNVHRSSLTCKNHDAQVDATLYKRDLGQDSLQTSMSSIESEVNNASMVSAPPAAGDSTSRGDNHPRVSVLSRRSLVRHDQGLARAEPIENLPGESERILQARNLLSSLRLSAKAGMRPRQGSASSHANSD